MIPFTTSTDLTARLRQVSTVFVACAATQSATVNLRNKSATGPIHQSIKVPPMTTEGNSSSINFPRPLIFPSGLYVEVASGTVAAGGVAG
jgi:hypothetical protein